MRRFAIILAVLSIAAMAVIWIVLTRVVHSPPCGPNPWVVAYFSQARIPMFAGFLTLGSFLLTLQTAIIQRLKEAYNTDSYKLRFLVLREKNPKVRYYGSLERMSAALSTNVILALATATAQMTLGFCQATWSTSICIGLAIASLGLVVFLTIQLFLAHKEWFDMIEELKNKELFPPAD